MPLRQPQIDAIYQYMAYHIPRINPDGLPPSKLISNLKKWMIKNGAFIHENIQARPYSFDYNLADDEIDERNYGVWGMFATGPIKKGTIIGAVPYPLLIQQLNQFNSINNWFGKSGDRIDQAWQSESSFPNSKSNNGNQSGNFTIPSDLMSLIKKEPFGTPLVLFLHLCNLENSPHSTYLNTLPKSTPTTLLNRLVQFDPTLVPLGVDMRLQIEKHNRELLEGFDQVDKFITKHVPIELLNHKKFTFESFVYIMNIQMTRGFTGSRFIGADHLDVETVFVPFFDVINTNPARNVIQMAVPKYATNIINATGDGMFNFENGGLTKSAQTQELDHSQDHTFRNDIQKYQKWLLKLDKSGDEFLHYFITTADISPGEELFLSYQPAPFNLELPSLDKQLNEHNSTELLQKIAPINTFFTEFSKETTNTPSHIIDQDIKIPGSGFISNTANKVLNKVNLKSSSVTPIKVSKVERKFEPFPKTETSSSKPKPQNSPKTSLHSTQSPQRRSPSRFSNLFTTSSEKLIVGSKTRQKLTISQNIHSPALRSLISKLPSSHPLSITSLNETLQNNLHRYPYFELSDLYTHGSQNEPFPHSTLMNFYGMASYGVNRPYLLSKPTDITAKYSNSVGSDWSVGEYYHIKPAFLSNLVNLEQILISAENFYTSSLQNLNLHSFLTNSEYLNYLTTIKKGHSELSPAQILRAAKYKQREIVSKVSLPYKSPPLPFSSTFSPNTPPLHLALFLLDRLTLEKFSAHNIIISGRDKLDETYGINGERNDKNKSDSSFGEFKNKQLDAMPKKSEKSKNSEKPDKNDFFQFNPIKLTSQPSPSSSSILTSPTSPTSPSESSKKPVHFFNTIPEHENHISEAVNNLQDSELYANNTIMDSHTLPITPPLRTPLDTRGLLQAIKTPSDAMDVVYPFRFGLGKISPKLELFCYVLAASAVDFDKISLSGYLHLLTICESVFDGVDHSELIGDDIIIGKDGLVYENGRGDELPSVGIDEFDKHKEKLEHEFKHNAKHVLGDFKNDPDGQILNSTVFGSSKQSKRKSPKSVNNDGKKHPHINSHFGQLIGSLSPNEAESDPLAQLHLPAYCIMMSLIETIITAQYNDIEVSNDLYAEFPQPPTPLLDIDKILSTNDSVRADLNQNGSNPVGSKSDKSIQKIKSNPKGNAPWSLSPTESAIINHISTFQAECVENIPNFVLQHIFNSIATKIHVENQFWDLDSIPSQQELIKDRPELYNEASLNESPIDGEKFELLGKQYQKNLEFLKKKGKNDENTGEKVGFLLHYSGIKSPIGVIQPDVIESLIPKH
jgi:hypothetical protein